MVAAGMLDEVRANAAEIAAEGRWVRIDAEALARLAATLTVPAPALDGRRLPAGLDAAATAQHLLMLDAINFGSGWAPTLHKRFDPELGRAVSAATTIAWNLTDHVRRNGPWPAGQLRDLHTRQVAAVLGQPADHELMALYAQALRELGRFLGARSALDLVSAAGAGAERFAVSLARGMALWNDPGFYKRAQIAAADLALAGVAAFEDLERLTCFADNLVPHVLRCDGVLVYAPELAALVDAGTPLRPGPAERAIRGCGVHAVELLAAATGRSPMALDMALWNRGQTPDYKSRPRHRTRCVFY